MTDSPYDTIGVRPPDHLGREIIVCEVGSTLHGTGLPGHEDFDMMGVTLEPLETVLTRQPKTWQWRTQPEGVPSGPGDIDLQLHPLRKFVSLALQGNPSIILPLFAPEDRCMVLTDEGRELRALHRCFLSKTAAARYLGYLNAQRERLLGIRRGRGPKQDRIEVTEHGFDTKYAMHAVRLGYQGIEFLTTGKITVPMQPPTLDDCRAIRHGEWPLSKITDLLERQETLIKGLGQTALVPDEPDTKTIYAWMADTYKKEWQ